MDDLDAIQQFAVAYLRNEQDRDLAALGVHFDNYFLESSLYSDGKVALDGRRDRRVGHDLRTRRRALAEDHRVRRTTASSPDSADPRPTTKTA